jgi:hypothetical protein
MTDQPQAPGEQDRREFLKKCGRFAVITPPAITLLLSTSLSSDALAKSGGREGPAGKGGWRKKGHEHGKHGHFWSKWKPGRRHH